ncbi:MAG: hypothetical protein E6Q97_20540, partial [Desulfurellales bacterium]
MPNKFIPLFHVSSKAYGPEADEVAKALATRFTTFRFGVSSDGSATTKENAPIHEFLAKSYPPSELAEKPAPA